jgi:transcriptional regulator with XRE-family HTH domain
MSGDRHVKFEDWLVEEMEDEAFRTEYERLGPGFEVARLRMMRGLTQQELAERVGTHQSSISRLESGEREPSLSFLRRVVDALNGHLEVRIRAREEVAVVEETDAATVTTDWQFFDKPRMLADRADQQSFDVLTGEMMPA